MRAALELDKLGDPFLSFVEYARSVLFSCGVGTTTGMEEDKAGPTWSWIVSRILKTCRAYSSGVTAAILLADLSQAWNELNRDGVSKKRPHIVDQLKKKNRKNKLENTVSVDSIWERNFLSLTSCMEVIVVDAFLLPGTDIHMLTLGDFWSSNTIDLYLHRRYYDLADPCSGILKKGREIFLTGCYLRTATSAVGCPRLMPTEYLVIILDDEGDDDAMLIAAQFCSDTFSAIDVAGANSGVSYSLYARIESVGPTEAQEGLGNVQRREVTLVDNDGIRLKFLLWGEQVLLGNLLSTGSMLALDRPYIEASNGITLEYGSLTQLYLVPFIQQEEQVFVSSTQSQGYSQSQLGSFDTSLGSRVSQVTLPRDSQGSIDFSAYPFRLLIADLHDKMTGVALYGVVGEIFRDRRWKEDTYCLKIEDATGAMRAVMRFSHTWSLGRVGTGQTIYVTGLSCNRTNYNGLQLSWIESDSGTSFVNLSCMPALLNSSCLHHSSSLSDLTRESYQTHVCRVRLDLVDRCQIDTRLEHLACGSAVEKIASGDLLCSFCNRVCDTEVTHSLHLELTVTDESGKVFARCAGQTAAELLQISPDEFLQLPEDEQFIYPSSLDKESFKVALVRCLNQSCPQSSTRSDLPEWEITCAIKCD